MSSEKPTVVLMRRQLSRLFIYERARNNCAMTGAKNTVVKGSGHHTGRRESGFLLGERWRGGAAVVGERQKVGGRMSQAR